MTCLSSGRETQDLRGVEYKSDFCECLLAGSKLYEMRGIGVNVVLPNITQHNDLMGQLGRLYGRVG